MCVSGGADLKAVAKILVQSALVWLAACLFFQNIDGALAQSVLQAEETISEEFQPLIDAAKEKGLSVIVVTSGDDQKNAVVTGPGLGDRVLKVRSELGRIIRNAPQTVPAIEMALERVSPDGTMQWLLWAVVTAIAGIILGTVPSLYTRKWLQSYFRDKQNNEPENRAEKISFLLFRASLILMNFTIVGIVAVLVAVIFDSGHDASRGTIGVIIGAYLVYRVFRHVIFFNLIAPDNSVRRVINLGDEAANTMQRDWRFGMMLVVSLIAFGMWMALIGLPPDPLKFLAMLSLLISAIIVGGLVLKHRQDIAGILLGAGDPATKPAWRKLLASQWHLLVLGYLVIAWIISSVRIVMNLPSSLAILGAPVVAIVVSLAVYGLLLVVIDRFYSTREKRFNARVASALEEAAAARQIDERINEEAEMPEDEEVVVNLAPPQTETRQEPVFTPVLKPLLEDAAGIFISIIAVGYILGTWDVNIGERGNPVTAFMDTVIIAFFAWFLYRAVVAYIDNQLEAEGIDGMEEAGEPGEEMSGKSASRLATLLPLMRNVLVAGIIVLSGMVILSNMGVDIAPLFAGAGVIGLAVGFGAQTLIRDIFSGGFFLFDDAFRKGEYIELGDIRGTVEKISLRSFQLRHHNGPLHTIPFGEIKQLTNYSRDWVMMKLPLRVTYDTDVERVRKLLKKLGQSLLEHKDVGHLFVQPLKSQGVYKMEDSAMIIRVKFMTKPGDQFVTRKVVYAAIRDLFEKEGIRFANKEVTVRLAEEPSQPLTDAEKSAIAAAARAAGDDEALQQPKKVDEGP